jgi:predicted dinucleotide-binding enzyme
MKMAYTKTVAIVGANSEIGTTLSNNLSRYKNRLLLIDTDMKMLANMVSNIKKYVPGADLEVMNCERDGCWEADVIFLAGGAAKSQNVARKIKEVATQKLVIYISHEVADGEDPLVPVHEIMPHSRLVQAQINRNWTGASLYGEKEDAVKEAGDLLAIAGFYPTIAKNLSAA